MDFQNTYRGIVTPQKIISINSQTMYFFSTHSSKHVSGCRGGHGLNVVRLPPHFPLNKMLPLMSAAPFRSHRKQPDFVVRCKKGSLKPILSGKPQKLVLETCLPSLIILAVGDHRVGGRGVQRSLWAACAFSLIRKFDC